MKIENVKIDKVTPTWVPGRRDGKAKGTAKILLSFETDDMAELAHVNSLYQQTVTVDFGVLPSAKNPEPTGGNPR